MQTINEFLISIGYDVRDRSEFEVALKKVEGFILKLGAALLAAEAAIQAVVVKTTMTLDQVNFAAQRTGASVAGLQALAYALEQTGRGSSRAEDMLGRLSEQLRRFPATETVLQRIGVRARENGHLRDTSEILRDAVKALNAMPSYVIASSYAGILGISEDDYAHIRANAALMQRFEDEQRAMSRRFGVDRNAAGATSTVIAGAWRSSLLALDALMVRVALAVEPILTPMIDGLRDWLGRNQDRIVAVCRAFVDAAAWLGRAVLDLVSALKPLAVKIMDLADAATGDRGFIVAAELIAGAWLVGVAARFLGPVALVIAALAGLAALLSASPAKAAEVQAGPMKRTGEAEKGSTKPKGIFARAMAGVTRRRTHGASGSWGDGGASGSWGEGDAGQTYDRGGGNPGTDPIQTNLTTYSPRRGGDSMEGGYPSSVRGPDGQAIVRTLEAYRKGEADYVTVAGNSAFYGRKYTADTVTYRVGDETFTLKNVPMVVHDTGGAFKGAPEGRFDVPVGRDLNPRDTNQGLRGVTFRPGWAPKPIESAPLPPARPPELRRMDQESMFMAPALGTTGDDLSLSARQETEIVVHGDPDPTKTATEVSAAQRRINKGFVDHSEKAIA